MKISIRFHRKIRQNFLYNYKKSKLLIDIIPKTVYNKNIRYRKKNKTKGGFEWK